MRSVFGIVLIFVLAFAFSCASLATQTDAEGQVVPSVSQPTALKAIIVPDGFRLTWNPSEQDSGVVTGYEILRSELASGPFVTIARVSKGVGEYTDTKASPEHVYYYKVRAIAGNAYSPYSNTVTGER